MESQLPSEAGYVPAATIATYQAPHRSIFQRRGLKVVGAIGALTLTAALSVQFADAGHAATVPAANVAAAKVVGAHQSLKSQLGSIHSASTGTGSGGIHGSFSVYEGAGGGVEFWFDPSTGVITIATGVGIGEGGSGSLSYYTPGTAPAAGVYEYANISLSAGTFGSVSVNGTYSFNSSSFNGSASATVDGRTVTLTGDGAGLSVNVLPSAGAAGFTANTGVEYVFSFDASSIAAICADLWNDITSAASYLNNILDQYILNNYQSDDVTGSDTSVSSDDSSDDSGDDSSSASDDDGSGGGGGAGDDSDAPIDEE